MPYWLESDTFAADPIWEVLAEGNLDRVDRLQAAYARLKATASHLMTDGYLTAQAALAQCRGRRQVLDLLCTAVLDRDPLIHRQGDECACLGDAWVDGYAYRIHNFLRKNPSRSEYNRNRAQKADLRNPALKKLVHDRDGGCCRYCRSGPLSPKAVRARDRRKVLTFDHVDPDLPAGPNGENLVTACDACNTHKAHRTPYEADMLLLAVPTPQERHQWRQRPLQLCDRPPYDPGGQASDHAPITDETVTKHRHDADRHGDPNGDPNTGPDADPTGPATPGPHPQPADHVPEQRSAALGNPLGSGRVGYRADLPHRDSADPDIYTRRPRTYPGPDPYDWPPGAVPATPHLEGDPPS